MLTVEENFRLALVGARIVNEKEELEKAYQMFPALKEKSRDRARTLSGGQLQMLANARALLGPAQLTLMDEPTEGLAPIVIEQVGKINFTDQTERQGRSAGRSASPNGPERGGPTLYHRQRPSSGVSGDSGRHPSQ